MNPALSEALKEAYAMAPSNVFVIETIELQHPDIEGVLRFVAGYENLEAWIEGQNSEVDPATVFERGAFRIKLPSSGNDGFQNLQITVDNVDRRISDFCQIAATHKEPIVILYRPYLSNDLTAPQLDPPLTLYLRDVTISEFNVTGKASFADIINRKFPSQLYTRTRFPSLGSGR